MTTNQPRILYTIAFFLLIFVTGFWLSRSGRPYGVLLLTVHKLLSVGAVVFLTVVIVRVNRSVGLGSREWIVAIVTGLLFLGTIATGGLLSATKPMPELVHRLHQVAPFLTLVSMAATLYLLFKRK